MMMSNTQGESLRLDAERDRVLYSIIQQFLEGQLTSAELKERLQVYGREFEATPYKVRATAINWKAYPEQFFAYLRVVGELVTPVFIAWSNGELTTTQVARTIAPFFLVMHGYGFETGPGENSLSQEQFRELSREIATFAAH